MVQSSSSSSSFVVDFYFFPRVLNHLLSTVVCAQQRLVKVTFPNQNTTSASSLPPFLLPATWVASSPWSQHRLRCPKSGNVLSASHPDYRRFAD